MNYANVNRGILIRKDMIDAIAEYITVHQYPPTIREIGAMVGLSSTATVHGHLQALIKEGKLETDALPGEGLSRAIRVPGLLITKN